MSRAFLTSVLTGVRATAFQPRRTPSRPGEFHPEPLTDSGLEPLDSSGSCHPMRAAALRQNRRAPPARTDLLHAWIQER